MVVNMSNFARTINEYVISTHFSICFYFCTDQLLLRYCQIGRNPIIKQLPWLQDKCIASMCFDPTLSWLLIVTLTSQEAFIVPALSVVVIMIKSTP